MLDVLGFKKNISFSRIVGKKKATKTAAQLEEQHLQFSFQRRSFGAVEQELQFFSYCFDFGHSY